MAEGVVQPGPRLSDSDFFGQLLDMTRPGLADIPGAVASGDFAAAAVYLASHESRFHTGDVLRIDGGYAVF